MRYTVYVQFNARKTLGYIQCYLVHQMKANASVHDMPLSAMQILFKHCHKVEHKDRENAFLWRGTLCYYEFILVRS